MQLGVIWILDLYIIKQENNDLLTIAIEATVTKSIPFNQKILH